MMETNVKKVVQGALFLTIAGVISKGLSALYRVPLQNLTGDLGFYIYQQIYPFIGTVMILSLYGFPVAVSKLTAEAIQENKHVTFNTFYLPLFLILFVINGIFLLTILLIAPFLAEWVGDIQLTSLYKSVSFLFLLVPFLALLRGIFQGHEEMRPTAYSQLMEQLIRVTIIVIVAYFIYLGEIPLYYIGDFGVVASLAGMIVAIIGLFMLFFRSDIPFIRLKNEKIPWCYYFFICLTIGIVASLNHLILILIQLADVLTLVPSLITYGLTPIEAMQAKGIFDRGQPLIQFGLVFGSSFALALVPTVVQGNVKKDRKRLYHSIQEAIMFSIYLAAGATIGLILIFPETNILLFMNTDGTGSLQIVVISIFLTSITVTGCTILQSLGYTKLAALLIGLTFVIKIILNKMFVPFFSIYGSAMATVMSLVFLCFFTIVTIYKKLPGLSLFRQIHWRAFVIANVGMALYL